MRLFKICICLGLERHFESLPSAGPLLLRVHLTNNSEFFLTGVSPGFSSTSIIRSCIETPQVRTLILLKRLHHTGEVTSWTRLVELDERIVDTFEKTLRAYALTHLLDGLVDALQF